MEVVTRKATEAAGMVLEDKTSEGRRYLAEAMASNVSEGHMDLARVVGGTHGLKTGTRQPTIGQHQSEAAVQ